MANSFKPSTSTEDAYIFEKEPSKVLSAIGTTLISAASVASAVATISPGLPGQLQAALDAKQGHSPDLNVANNLDEKTQGSVTDKRGILDTANKLAFLSGDGESVMVLEPAMDGMPVRTIRIPRTSLGHSSSTVSPKTHDTNSSGTITLPGGGSSGTIASGGTADPSGAIGSVTGNTSGPTATTSGGVTGGTVGSTGGSGNTSGPTATSSGGSTSGTGGGVTGGTTGSTGGSGNTSGPTATTSGGSTGGTSGGVGGGIFGGGREDDDD